ncbi:uncharacterized protein (DUF1499 family) [Polymorphobacter multimanifer]|uniref:Uncharacterized protein (DUF1499 family) n=1 Tax=Polymorphobacter multimanifer TaxID=1070431 RepID=A0A841L6H8_9SPHN|nr:DUF1499 domain-containing protein [Polymorphobacter multimanifer]MBB6228217.1 uncharacterized protein (DUF1499 family) [Polymorphobacter multimanifer]
MTPVRWPRNLALLTLFAAFLVLIAGPGIKSGILPWQAALLGFAVGALVCGVGAVAMLVALVRRHRSPLVMTALVVGLIGFLIPMSLIAEARGVPPIHDITTDTGNPPEFFAITPELRGPGTNPVTYDPAIAPLQAAAYPLVRPVTLAVTPSEAFFQAEKAARAMGWEIVATDSITGRIEATDTVPWWGFKDDIVIRLTPEGQGTRIDVRSKSRVGKGDVGVNARRITDYMNNLANG